VTMAFDHIIAGLQPVAALGRSERMLGMIAGYDAYDDD